MDRTIGSETIRGGTDFESEKETPVTWRSLPRKGQLAILVASRLFDFLHVASLQAYLFYQLKSFDPTLSDSKVSIQAGALQGAFTAAQFVTSILWGRVADADWGGRKNVLLVALFGTAFSCVGFSFSTSFYQAVFFRTVAGTLNGGNVGVVRTMVAENIKEKRFQPRAFLLLPISFNVAALFGPVLGGLLANPVDTYPKVFGPNSVFGGENGVRWMISFPYALPSLLSACFLFFTAIFVFLGLEETLVSRKAKFDAGLHLRRLWGRRTTYFRTSPVINYSALDTDESDNSEGHEANKELSDLNEMNEDSFARLANTPKLPFRRIWTSTVLFTLLAQAIFDFHLGAFHNLWLLFLSTPRFDPSQPDNSVQQRHLPFVFTGGLGMLPENVGIATAVLGAIGIIIQFAMYPKVHQRFGTVRCYRIFSTLFPISYALIPYLSVVHSSTAPPSQVSGLLIWFSIAAVLSIQVTARTFTLPATIILLNNCSPHPSVLSTVHGIGQAVSSAFRTLGPVLSGYWYGISLNQGVIGAAWWAVSIVALFGCVACVWVPEGSGHEIILPSEEDNEDEVHRPG